MLNGQVAQYAIKPFGDPGPTGEGRWCEREILCTLRPPSPPNLPESELAAWKDIGALVLMTWLYMGPYIYIYTYASMLDIVTHFMMESWWHHSAGCLWKKLPSITGQDPCPIVSTFDYASTFARRDAAYKVMAYRKEQGTFQLGGLTQLDSRNDFGAIWCCWWLLSFVRGQQWDNEDVY